MHKAQSRYLVLVYMFIELGVNTDPYVRMSVVLRTMPRNTDSP